MAEPIHLISNLGKRDHHNQFTLEALGKDCCYKLSIAAIALILYCDLPSHLCDRRSPHRDRFLPQPRSPLTLTAIALPLNHDRPSPQTRSLLILAAIT